MSEHPANADLSACDREPIHLIGRVQAFGFLLAVSDANWWIERASVNAATALGVPLAGLIGHPLDRFVLAEAVHTVRGAMQGNAAARLFGVQLTAGGPGWDIALHAVDGAVVIECEMADADARNAAALVLAMTMRLRAHDTEATLCRAAVREMRALTGFDRVMIYRFGADASGEVVAESVRGGLPPYLGLHYPASDIPMQARGLYTRNWLRVAPDVDEQTFAIEPEFDAAGAPLDLSRSTLRAFSPVHLDYLRAMGVKASMSVSLMRRNALWGLFICHHGAPHRVSFARRTAAELLGHTVSQMVENRERDEEAAFEVRGQRLQQQLLAAMAEEGAGLDGLVGRLDGIADLLGADGIGLTLDGHSALRGLTPSAPQFEELVWFLRQGDVDGVHARHDIGAAYPAGRAFANRAAGMMVLPLSRPARDFLVFFRKEAARSVAWAGDPAKPVMLSPGAMPAPRPSFDHWRETVRGQSLPWKAVECRVAEGLRVGLHDTILRLNDMNAAERRRSQQRQELLIAELNHRLRNILGLIRGVISQSADIDQTVEDFAGVIGGRILALARAHDQITAEQWGPAPFTALVAAEAGAYRDGDRDRVVVSGADALISPEAFTTIALVLHEMMTNSAKYGALSARIGRVEIATSFDALGRYLIVWAEQDGPPVRPPQRKGFGSTVIERSLAHDLKGDARIEYAPAGLRAEFTIPAAYAGAADAGRSPAILTGATPEPALAVPDDVLIVEDNMIIALDAEDMVKKLGVPSVRIASNVAAALDLIAARRPDFALLDVNLGNETSFAVASTLLGLGVPFAFASGYGEQAAFPEAVAATPRLRKPFAADALREIMKSLTPSAG